MSDTMRLRVNGTVRELTAGTSVATLVASMLPSAIDDTGRPRGVAVAVDAEVVPRRDWEDTPLHDGDVVEIVSATPGG